MISGISDQSNAARSHGNRKRTETSAAIGIRRTASTIVFRMAVFILLLAVYAGRADAQSGEERKQHPIDGFLSECEGKNPSTHGMLDCLREAEKRWDKELNLWYKELRARLPQDGKDALQKAQKTWIAFRDSEFSHLSKLYARMDGTMYLVMQAADRVDQVRKRALELQSQCDLLKEAAGEEK
jgi:uncharacterized protein YecT (DUF1311 family)